MNRTNAILLLESDARIAEEINIRLRNFGYYISHHISKTANIFSLIVKEKPDLVLMEVKPGEELKDAETAHLVYDNYQVPVVFLTTPQGKSIIEKSRRCKQLDFVFKPLVEKELISTVELTLFRHSMERKLQESERKYNELSNSIFQAIIECDLDGKIQSVNRRGMEMLGITHADVEKGVLLTDYIHPNECGSILEVSRQSAFIDAGNLNREFTMVNKFGKKYSVEELLTPVYTNYKLSGYRGILIDITNRKLKQSLVFIFNTINSQFDRADADIEEISAHVVKALKNELPDLDVAYVEGEQGREATSACFGGYTSLVKKWNKPLLLRGRELDAFNRREKLDNPTNNAACWMGFPVTCKTKPYGVFTLSSTSNRNALSIKDFEKLIDFFENINQFLGKVSYLKELKRSKNLFESLVNTINEGLIKIDLESTITYANNRLEGISGYKHEEVIGKKCKNFLQTKDHRSLAKIIECRRNGISSQYEMSILVKSGEYKKFYISGAPYRDENGNIIGAIGTFTDVTAKNEQLALFSATETLLSEITSAIDVAFWIYSFETKSIQYLSPAFKKLFETELDDIYKMNSLRKFIHPDDVKKVVERNKTNFSQGEFELKYRIITPKGSLKWIQDKSVSIKNEEGKVIKIIGYAQEITKLKLTEEKLVKSEMDKDNIIRSIPDSFMIFGKNDEILNSYFKPDEKRLLRIVEKRIHGKKIDRVFDERTSDLIVEHAREVVRSKSPVVFELSIDLPSQQWYEVRMSLMTDDKVLMIIRNITSVKNNLNKIQKLFNITEQTKELIMITDSSGRIEYVNPMFTMVTGYDSHEVLGSKPSILKSRRHSRSFYAELWNTLKTGEVFKGDFYNYKKSGELFIEEKIITPYIDMNGEITNFISTGRDVTHERKNALKTNKHKHLERTLAIKQQKNRTLSLIQGHENERKKFAREIHEGLNQMLSVAMMNLETISTNDVINVEQKAKLEFVNKMVAEIMQELRGISTNLSPVSLFEFGLHAVIQQMINRLNSEIRTVDISFKSNIAGLRFAEKIEINVYRIIQEALQNARNHSKANKILVTLNFRNNELTFLIRDNGVGMNRREFEMKKKKFFGISTLEERAAVMGAQLELTTTKNKGFEINIAVKTNTINV